MITQKDWFDFRCNLSVQSSSSVGGAQVSQGGAEWHSMAFKSVNSVWCSAYIKRHRTPIPLSLSSSDHWFCARFFKGLKGAGAWPKNRTTGAVQSEKKWQTSCIKTQNNSDSRGHISAQASMGWSPLGRCLLAIRKSYFFKNYFYIC